MLDKILELRDDSMEGKTLCLQGADEVAEKLKKKMEQSAENVFKTAEKYETNYRV